MIVTVTERLPGSQAAFAIHLEGLVTEASMLARLLQASPQPSLADSVIAGVICDTLQEALYKPENPNEGDA